MYSKLPYDILQIDTGLMGPEIATCYLLEGKFDDDVVDWLSLISEKNDLKKFFSY